MNYLKKIIGLQIKHINVDKYSTGFLFTDGSGLGVYNRHKFFSGEPEDFIGAKVTRLDEEDDIVRFIFSNSGKLEIYLKDSDYIDGSEAFPFRINNGPIIVQQLEEK